MLAVFKLLTKEYSKLNKGKYIEHIILPLF